MNLDKNKCCNLFWNRGKRGLGLGLGCVQAAFKRQRRSIIKLTLCSCSRVHATERAGSPGQLRNSGWECVWEGVQVGPGILGCPGNLPRWPLEHHLEPPLAALPPARGGLGIVLLQPATRERHLPGPLENFQIILVSWTNSIKIIFSVEKEGNLEKKIWRPSQFF